MVALWLRRPAYVYFSGLLLNVAGTILWWSWADASVNIFHWDLGTVAGLVAANVICLAIGSVAWSLLRFRMPRAFRTSDGTAASSRRPTWRSGRRLPVGHPRRRVRGQ